MGSQQHEFRVLDKNDTTPAIEVGLTTTTAATTTGQIINTSNGGLDENSGLPTYQDVLIQKRNEAAQSGNPDQHHPANMHILFNTHNYDIPPPPLPTLSASAVQLQQANLNYDIGTDCIFMCAFMMSFLFNWVGFFASVCLMPTIAAKYGALSGFGLSMAKWATIVRYQEWMVNVNDFQQKLFFWVFMITGFYLFIRGLIAYITLKYNPNSLVRSRSNYDFWLFR